MAAPGLRERKKVQSWRDIRAAALRLMSDRGYEAVTVDDIIRSANVSRTTFFNYFDTKEAVVFDPDPEDRSTAQQSMRARPTDEPLWASLQAIVVQNVQRYSDRLAFQKMLKAQSPKLTASGRDVTDYFADDLRSWAAGRATPDEAPAVLLVNLALAVAMTAYEQWDPDRPFSELIDLLTGYFRATFQQFVMAERPSASSIEGLS